ncbi:MAG: RsmE family RNA methyltransferase [Ilumatobacteraceae bacterium]
MKSELRHSAAHVFVDDLSVPLLSEDDRHHILRVLRVESQQFVSVSDGRGSWSLANVGADGVLDLIGERMSVPAPTRVLTVAFAPTKGDRPDDVVRKLTEIGIDRIIPIADSKRGVVRWDESKAIKNIDRLKRIARESAMQSRRVWLPEVMLPCALVDIVTKYGAALAEPSGVRVGPIHTCIAIGPEGGFNSEELALSDQHVSLGENVLRGETAAIAAGILMDALRGERS